MTDTPKTPRGIRNNNPGNIRFNPNIHWVGQCGQDKGGFARFSTPEDGLRAIAVLLRVYHNYHHCVTLADYITRWAPPAENDTQAYTHFMSVSMLVDPRVPLHLDLELPGMVMAIVSYENGECPYDVGMIRRAIHRAWLD